MNWQFEAGRGGLYGTITIIALLIGGWLWSRRWRRRPQSFSIFIGAICGAYIGAKLIFLAAEGWMVFGGENWVMQWLTGKSIIGALLGGYGGVEIVKKLIGHREPTGDWFAVGVPLSIAVGRLGCLQYGCCPGRICPLAEWWTLTDQYGLERWPAVPLELGFNLLFVVAILPIAIRGAGRGQLFHGYLIAYGLFRFWHEFHRATPKLWGEISGYQVGAVALVMLGVTRGWVRFQKQKLLYAGENQPPTQSTGGAKE